MIPAGDNMAVLDLLIVKSTSAELLFYIWMLSTVSIASWNVRGISDNAIKREHLVNDSKLYNFDIVCLQETKCRLFEEQEIERYKLILLEQSKSHHYGLGFLICPSLVQYIVSWKSISGRVAYIDFRVPTRNGTFNSFRLINAYGPTMKLASDDPKEIDTFYRNLRKAKKIPARHDLLYIGGDFNSRLGRRTIGDCSSGMGYFMGKENGF